MTRAALAALLIWHEPSIPEAIDPLHAVTGTEQRLAALVYDSLTQGGKSRVLDLMAIAPDGRIHLRVAQDLVWHDEQAVRGEDVCFSLAAVTDPGTASPLALGAELAGHKCEVSPTDPRLAVVWLPAMPVHPFDSFEVPLLPAHAFRGPTVARGHAAFRVPVGTTKLVARRACLPGPVCPPDDGSNQTWDFFPIDGGFGFTLRQDGANSRVPARDLPLLRAAGVPLWSVTTTAPWGIWLDTRSGPLARVEVRRALDRLLDRTALRATVDGTDPDRVDQPLRLTSGPFPMNDPRSSAGIPPTRHDAARAEADLIAAGFTRSAEGWLLDGHPLTLSVPAHQDLASDALATAIADQLREAGLSIDIVDSTVASWTAGWRSGNAVADLVVAAAPPLPGGNVRGWFRPDGPSPATDPRVLAALAASEAARDDVEQIAASRELHAALADALPVLWLWTFDGWAAIPVTRAVPTPDDWFGRLDAWIR